MAECCPLSYRQLAWATVWYLGDDQLQAANDALVDHLHQLQIAADWGTGTFSSSDGAPQPAGAPRPPTPPPASPSTPSYAGARARSRSASSTGPDHISAKSNS